MRTQPNYLLDSIAPVLPESAELRLQLGSQIMAQAQAEIQANLADLVRDICEATLSRDSVLSVDEAAELLKVSGQWIRERVKRQNSPIPALRDGVVRIKKSDLLEWFENETRRELPKLRVMPTAQRGEIPIRKMRKV